MLDTEYTLVVGLKYMCNLQQRAKCLIGAQQIGLARHRILLLARSLWVCQAHSLFLTKAIQWAILIGKALNCSINRISKFDRNITFILIFRKDIRLVNMMSHFHTMAIMIFAQNFQNHKSVFV